MRVFPSYGVNNTTLVIPPINLLQIIPRHFFLNWQDYLIGIEVVKQLKCLMMRSRLHITITFLGPEHKCRPKTDYDDVLFVRWTKLL